MKSCKGSVFQPKYDPQCITKVWQKRPPYSYIKNLKCNEGNFWIVTDRLEFFLNFYKCNLEANFLGTNW